MLSEVGGSLAFLLNVCSYPAGIPGSDPSDCVFAPNVGFLTIVKNANPDDETAVHVQLVRGRDDR